MIWVVWSWNLVASTLVTLAAIACVIVPALADRNSVDVLCVEWASLWRSWATWLWVLLTPLDSREGRRVNAWDVGDPWESTGSRDEGDGNKGLHVDGGGRRSLLQRRSA